MGNQRRKKVKSTVVISSGSKSPENLKPVEGKKEVFREKRSRSEGDGQYSNEAIDFKSMKTKEHCSRKEKTEMQRDLREVLNENSTKNSRDKSRKSSRSRSKQRSPRRSEDETEDNSTQTSKKLLSSDSEEELNMNFRQKGDKFYSERSETVTTPLDYEYFEEEENSEKEFFDGIGPTRDESEVIFTKFPKANKKERNSSKDKSDLEMISPEKERKRRRSRSRSRSKNRSYRKERKHQKKMRKSYYSTSESSDSESGSDKHHRRKSYKKKSKKRKRRRYSSSSDDDSDDKEYEKISKIVKQYVKKGKTEEDQVSKIVKQVVKQIHEDGNEGNLEITKSPNKEIRQTPIKSPSVPTIYKPSLQQIDSRNTNLPRFTFDNSVKSDGSPQIVTNNFNTNKSQSVSPPNKGKDQGLEFIDNFIKSVRIGQDDKGLQTPKADEPTREEERLIQARNITQKAILDAERNKAELRIPQGNNSGFQEFKQLIKDLLADKDDDDFFHMTCHLDSQLVLKIKKGLYVELEKLIQKPKHLKTEIDGRQVLVEKDGEQYYVPYKGKDSPKINNVKKWEEAFRLYAAIYCQETRKDRLKFFNILTL